MSRLRLTVQVTAEDIELGTPGDAEACPLARALLRCAVVYHAAVCHDDIIIEARDRSFRIQSPKDIVEFVKSFDAGKAVAPFSFDMEFESDDDEDATGDQP